MRPDDPRHDGQTEPGTAAGTLGAVERLENMLPLFRRHTRAGVADRDGERTAVRVRLRGVQRQLTPVWHRVGRVEHQVDQELVQRPVYC